MKHHRIVALDFDGVLHAYERGWTGPVPEDPPVPGAREFVRWLQEELHSEVVVFTTRAETEEGRVATREWLARHGFPELEVTNVKPRATLFIDDRAAPRFEGSFDDVRGWIERNRGWAQSWTQAPRGFPLKPPGEGS